MMGNFVGGLDFNNAVRRDALLYERTPDTNQPDPDALLQRASPAGPTA